MRLKCPPPTRVPIKSLRRIAPSRDRSPGLLAPESPGEINRFCEFGRHCRPLPRSAATIPPIDRGGNGAGCDGYRRLVNRRLGPQAHRHSGAMRPAKSPGPAANCAVAPMGYFPMLEPRQAVTEVHARQPASPNFSQHRYASRVGALPPPPRDTAEMALHAKRYAPAPIRGSRKATPIVFPRAHLAGARLDKNRHCGCCSATSVEPS